MIEPPRESSPRPERGGDVIPAMRVSYRLIAAFVVMAILDGLGVWLLLRLFNLC